MAEKNNKKQTVKNGMFSKKMTKQEWKMLSLKRNQKAILNDKTPFIVREAYRAARTNIVFSVSGSGSNECKIVVFTSANPGEGKTTSSLNIALTFAQTGSKILIIDGDMRKPRIHQYLGVVKTNGLSSILSNQKSFDEVVYRNVRDGLDCLTSGSIPPNPAELLASEAMGNLLEELKLQYDYIFIDTPPATVVTDAIAVSPYVSGIVLVVRQGFTEHEGIDRVVAIMKLAKVKLLGFFVNDIDPSSISYGAYNKSYGKSRSYSYRYSYKYGYKYSYRYGDVSSRLKDYGYKSAGYGYGYGDKIEQVKKAKKLKGSEIEAKEGVNDSE